MATKLNGINESILFGKDKFIIVGSKGQKTELMHNEVSQIEYFLATKKKRGILIFHIGCEDKKVLFKEKENFVLQKVLDMLKKIMVKTEFTVLSDEKMDSIIKIKTCKNCGEPYEGLPCPHCNSKYSRHTFKFYLVVGFIIMFITLALVMIGTIGLPDPITTEKYMKIEVGMTYDEVAEIIGSEGEVFYDQQLTDHYTTMRWSKGIKLIDVYFINGIVDSKTQVGLAKE